MAHTVLLRTKKRYLLNSSIIYLPYPATAAGLDVAGIRYTQHWGTTNDLNLDRVRRGYGSAVDLWNAARLRLLPSKAERNAFSSPALDTLGINA